MFVGQAASKNMDDEGKLDALAGGAAYRKFAIPLGFDLDEWLWAFKRVNLLNFYPGSAGKGDKFPIDLAERAAMRLEPMMSGFRVLLVGQLVARAFLVPRIEYCRWNRTAEYDYAVVPHPSGVNRWWNDPANVAHFDEWWKLSMMTGEKEWQASPPRMR